ncbi:MAG: NifB/NifX family molybdenum-iron cluster-binding protein [Chloroflexota bacterium]
MKIAFVSDDHKTISTHFGKAQFYEVFSVEAESVKHLGTLIKSNPQFISSDDPKLSTEDHPHHHDHNSMIAPIEDCEVLITRGMGRGAHISLQEHDIQPIITDILDITEAINSLIAGTLLDHPEKLH